MAASGQSDSATPNWRTCLTESRSILPGTITTVEAAEEATLEVAEEESAYPLTPPPMSSATPPPSRRAPTLMGLPLPSLPLPGVSAAAPSPARTTTSPSWRTHGHRRRGRRDQSRAGRHRVRAAASKDDDELTTALSAQASVERERALRKSLPPSLNLPLPHSYGGDSEFEDPEDSDGIGLASETPGISVDDDAIATSSYAADQDEPSSELEAVLAPRRPTASLGSLGGRWGRSVHRSAGSAALARSDGFGAARLPTPSPGFGGLSLPSPGQAPGRIQLPVLGAPRAGGFTLRSAHPLDGIGPMQALQIPAPSGFAATTAGTSSGFFRSAPMPVAAVGAFVVAAFIFGMVFGAKFFGGPWRPPSRRRSRPPRPRRSSFSRSRRRPPPRPRRRSLPPRTAVVPPPPPTTAVAPTPPARGGAVAEDTPAALKPAPKPVVKRAARPAVAVPETTAASLATCPRRSAAPAAPKAKPAKAKAKAWVNPFAE